MRIFSYLMAIALLAVSAQAITVEDFEGGSYVGPGTLVSDPDNAANTCLQLALTDNGGGYFVADVYSVDVSALAGIGGGTVTMDIFDYGKYFDGGKDGARWGVEGDLNSVAIGLLEKTWLGCEAGYAFNTSEYSNQTTSGIRTGSWFSAFFAGGPRQIDALDTDATDVVTGADGAWTTWSFTVDDGGYLTEIKRGDTVVIDVDSNISEAGVPLSKSVGALTDVWASAGRSNQFGLDGLLIDNVTFESGASSYHPGDANGDNVVDIQDFVLLKQNYGGSGASWGQGDFNGDGNVDIQDFVILKQNYGWAG